MKVLVTGSCGLIGGEAVHYYLRLGWEVWGVDNNLRKYFFGVQGDTSPRLEEFRPYPNYHHLSEDIRNAEAMNRCLAEVKPDFIVHTAAQPSHDWAAREPFTDFDVNAVGTLNLLEACRLQCPQAVFAFLSTNKVYGDAPNHLPLQEQATRFEYANELRGKGIDESLSVDQCLHSLFGASKLAADVLCQEYGKYFGLRVGIFRGGCLTGSKHSAVPLHGFLNYLVDCAVNNKLYTILGYQGKQVRDQIHASDVVHAIECFRRDPRCGEVYNMGGGHENSASILELVDMLRHDFHLPIRTEYRDEARKGDHICYYTNMRKFRSHYPEFKIQRDLRSIVSDIVEQALAFNQQAA